MQVYKVVTHHNITELVRLPQYRIMVGGWSAFFDRDALIIPHLDGAGYR